MGPVLLAALLVAYNNLRPEFGDRLYVVANLSVGVLLAAIARGLLASNAKELGLRRGRPKVTAAAGGAAVALVAPLYLFAAFEPTARLIADDRVAQLSVAGVAFQALIRIPFGTALFEEFAFRGVLFGLFSRRGRLFGAIASSVPFGLWHIRPTLQLIDVNTAEAQPALVGLFVTGAVAITAAAGLAFCWLRIKGRGIWAPVAFHAGVNSLSLVAAAIAHRQLG